MKEIVIVEDEPMMREELEEIFQKAGYPVCSIVDFQHVTEDILGMNHPALVLLDLNLPGASGFQICRELKQKSSLPVLVLTSRDQMKDELHALDLGADEYLTKPCRRERLLARTANLLRRYEGRSNLLEGPGFLLDKQTYTLYIHEESTVLPQNQGRLLETLLLHRGEVATKEELCISLWGTTEYIDENALQVNLTRLKKTMKNLKMECSVEPLRGVGYYLTVWEEKGLGQSTRL